MTGTALAQIEAARAELAALEEGPALGEPGYTRQMDQRRTELYQRIHDEPEPVEHTPAEMKPLCEYDHHAVTWRDPEERGYLPPGDVVKVFGPADWAVWDKLRPIAIAQGIEAEQLGALAAAVMEISAGESDAVIENANAWAEADLRKQWGAEYGRVMSDAEEFLTLEATPAERRILEAEVAGAPGLKIGSLPSIVNLFAKAGRALKGGHGSPVAGGKGTGMPGARQQATAGLQEQIRDLEAAHPLPQRTKAQDAQIRGLYERLYPDGEEDAARANIRLRG